MTNIIQLEQYRKRKLGQVGFKLWNAKFRKTFDETTAIHDLPDSVLLFLASPGEKSAGIIYQLIQQLKYPVEKLDDGVGTNEMEMDLMDIHLYLLDKVRFEMMLRLGWIDNYDSREKAILDLILEFDKSMIGSFDAPPQLCKNHPQFEDYQNLINREKELFIRKLFVNALIEFNSKIQNK